MEEDKMVDNTIEENNENEKTTIGIKTIMKHRNAFNDLPGATNEEKYLNLLEAYEKQKSKDKKINIAEYKESISKSFSNIERQLEAMESSVMEYQEELEDTYINKFGVMLDELKSNIENEEILKAQIITFENELAKVNESNKEQTDEIKELTDKVNDLELKNSEYIALNTSLVKSENDYINQLREKDVLISSKNLEISNLEKLHNEEVEQLEKEYKLKLEELTDRHETIINDYKNKIVVSDREKAVLENSVKSLSESLSSSNSEIHELKEEIKAITKETKLEIKAIEQDYKKEIKALEDKIKTLEIEKAREEAKNSNLEENLKNLHAEKNEINDRLEDAEKVKMEQSVNIKELDKEVGEYKALLVNKENHLKEVEQENLIAKEKIKSLEEENKKLQNKIDSLKENK